MKRDAVQLVIALLALAFGGAAEELAPKVFGVGFPFLLSAAAVLAVRRTPLAGLLFAIAAGAAEDALSRLPFALSISFFAVTAGLLRGFKLPPAAAAPAFCLYQAWLWIWLGEALGGNVFSRLLASVPVGAGTLAVVWGLIRWIDRKAAADEK